MILNKSILLFDLDGTIADTRVGVTRAVQYSLRHFGIDVPEPDKLVCFIGPPLRGSYKKHYGFNDEQAELAVAKFREYYAQRGVRECKPYEGIGKLLHSLRARGKTLLLATSKVEHFARQILEDFGLDGLFACIAGARADGSLVKKADVIRNALDRAGMAGPDGAVMIGDSRYDVLGAREVGLDVVGVLYGFGSRAELEEAGADVMIESVGDLAGLLGV